MPATLPDPPQPCPSPSSLEAVKTSCQNWLRLHVPGGFWDKFRECLVHENVARRTQLEVFNESNGFKQKRTLRKWLSDFGAVRVDKGFEWWSPKWFAYKCPETGALYADAGNHCYLQFFRETWPDTWTDIKKPEVMGDYIEAFLGFFYIKKVLKKNWISEQEEEVIERIECACVAHTALRWRAQQS